MTDPRTDELATRLAEVRDRLDAARVNSGRDEEVDLVVVTKFHPVTDVIRLARLGVRDVGENRVQEAAAKVTDLAEADAALVGAVRWNMIGHIQSKKAASVAGWADRVHSVDSVKVANGLERGRTRASDTRDGVDPLPVLIQLSLDGDTSRGGIGRDDLPGLADHIAGLDHLRLDGLMVIPPLQGEAAAHFANAAAIRDELRRSHPDAVEFSAGMSGDMEDAIAAGSTCVRVGTAILGPRPVA